MAVFLNIHSVASGLENTKIAVILGDVGCALYYTIYTTNVFKSKEDFF